jgi:hypothetical protein
MQFSLHGNIVLKIYVKTGKKDNSPTTIYILLSVKRQKKILSAWGKRKPLSNNLR